MIVSIGAALFMFSWADSPDRESERRRVTFASVNWSAHRVATMLGAQPNQTHQWSENTNSERLSCTKTNTSNSDRRARARVECQQT